MRCPATTFERAASSDPRQMQTMTPPPRAHVLNALDSDQLFRDNASAPEAFFLIPINAQRSAALPANNKSLPSVRYLHAHNFYSPNRDDVLHHLSSGRTMGGHMGSNKARVRR